ncbi:unnamed protein product [Laminaria digitata]
MCSVVETIGAGAGAVQRHPRRAQPPHHRRQVAPGAKRRLEEDATDVPGVGGERRPHHPTHKDHTDWRVDEWMRPTIKPREMLDTCIYILQGSPSGLRLT